MEKNIDASNKSIGRVASEAALLLMSKDNVSYQRNVAPDIKVIINNASNALIHPKKMTDKMYKSYSGYPGGLKEVPMEKVIDKKGYSELFRKAVYGMLPTNKLRARMMKNLTINE